MIRAGGDHCRRPWSPLHLKLDIVDFVAHLSVELIERYALREVSEAEMRRVEKHVARCSACKDRLVDDIGWQLAIRSPTMAFIRKTAKADKKKPAKR
jgi:hypothetical protein